MNYETKIGWLIDSQGFYKSVVLMLLKPNYKNGKKTMEWAIENKSPQEGESLVEVQPPRFRAHADDIGIIRRRWNGTSWVEGANPEEISAWEQEHPAPAAPPPDPRDLAITQLMREVAALKAKEAETIG